MVQLKFRSSWKQRVNRYRAIILVVATILIMAIAAGIVGYKLDWTGFNGNNKSSKTLWDWMQLLIILVALALIAFWFNRVERSNEQAITTDNQQETALQAYLDTMSELLLKEGLRESKPDAEVRSIARARTLTVLERLDRLRKGSLIRFLYESALITQGRSIIDFHDADLNDVHLAHFNLPNVDLSGAYMMAGQLGHVNLSNAKLTDVRLTGAVLGGANLSGTDLSNAWLPFTFLNEANLQHTLLIDAGPIHANLLGADLQHADLSGADLTEANLEYANLSSAKVTPEQLAKAKSLKGAVMTDGI